jgi:hypothetical protein
MVETVFKSTPTGAVFPMRLAELPFSQKCDQTLADSPVPTLKPSPHNLLQIPARDGGLGGISPPKSSFHSPQVSHFPGSPT